MYKKKSVKYITAYDKKIKKRVPFIVENGVAISMVTKTSFKYKPKRKTKKRK